MKVSSPDRAHLDLRGTPCLVKHTGPRSACQSERYHPKGRYSVKPAKKTQCQTSGSVSNQKVDTKQSLQKRQCQTSSSVSNQKVDTQQSLQKKTVSNIRHRFPFTMDGAILWCCSSLTCRLQGGYSPFPPSLCHRSRIFSPICSTIPSIIRMSVPLMELFNRHIVLHLFYVHAWGKYYQYLQTIFM